MKRNLSLIFAVGLFLSAKGDWKKIPIPALPEYSAPALRKFTLSNGIRVFHLLDSRFPVVYVELRLLGGDIADPEEYAGLSSILAETLRSGGSVSYPGDVLDETLDQIGASLFINSEQDSLFFTLRVLRPHLNKGLEILTDVLINPILPEDRIALAKRQLKTQLARRWDFPTSFATEEFRELVYGSRHPFARIPTEESVDAIQRQNLLEAHRQWLSANGVLVGIWGDVEEKDAQEYLQQYLAALPYKELPRLTIPEISSASPGIYYREKQDVNQSNIRMGTVGIQRDAVEYPAITVWNEILSGSFSARLFTIIRSQMGLAYSVGGGVGSNYAYPGMILISSGTKSESTVQAIQSIRKVVQEMHDGGFTEEEVEQAKQSILNSLIFEEDTPAEIVRRAMTLNFYGYPADFFQQYREKLQRVSRQEVLQAVQKLVHPENFIIYVLGNADQFDAPLTTLGPVSTLP